MVDYFIKTYLTKIIFTKCDCKRARLLVRFPLEEMKYANLPRYESDENKISNFHFLRSSVEAELSSTTQHTMRPGLVMKWRTECLNTRFPLPTLLCAAYRKTLEI